MHLHLDCQFGMAGDMLLAALIDAGADLEAIRDLLREAIPDDFELSCRRVARKGVAAMMADVTWHNDAPDRDGRGDGPSDSHSHDAGHARDHDRGHSHDHGREHHDHHNHHDRGDGRGRDREGGGRQSEKALGGPHRHLRDLLALLKEEGIPERARRRAERIFRLMAEAEAAVHGQTAEEVHFHEISGIDTAVDVIGSCLALELLEVDSVSASPLSVGSGMVMCEHGIFPVPAPATLEMLRRHNIPWRPGGDGERATPTGAALLAGLADSFGGPPGLTVVRIGYGAGHRDFPDVPNLLRAIIGAAGENREEESERPAAEERRSHTIIAEAVPEPSGENPLLPGERRPDGDRVVEFRFAVDDMTPEALAHLFEKCLAAGALDIYSVPAMMKKGRPGHEVTALAASGRAGAVADILWRQSTTFGMRVGERSRLTLARDFRRVELPGGSVRIKLGWLGGELIRRQPEYEDCRALAQATGEPLARIFALAVQAAEGLEG